MSIHDKNPVIFVEDSDSSHNFSEFYVQNTALETIIIFPNFILEAYSKSNRSGVHLYYKHNKLKVKRLCKLHKRNYSVNELLRIKNKHLKESIRKDAENLMAVNPILAAFFCRITDMTEMIEIEITTNNKLTIPLRHTTIELTTNNNVIGLSFFSDKIYNFGEITTSEIDKIIEFIKLNIKADGILSERPRIAM
jgi:hypothetical protein